MGESVCCCLRNQMNWSSFALSMISYIRFTKVGEKPGLRFHHKLCNVRMGKMLQLPGFCGTYRRGQISRLWEDVRDSARSPPFRLFFSLFCFPVFRFHFRFFKFWNVTSIPLFVDDGVCHCLTTQSKGNFELKFLYFYFLFYILHKNKNLICILLPV